MRFAIVALLCSSVALADGASGASGQPSSGAITVFNAQAATGTATSSAIPVGQYVNWLAEVTYSAGITGTFTACTLQPQASADNSNFVNYGNAITITPAASGSAQLTEPNHPNFWGGWMKWVYACSGYGSAGTLTLKVVYNATDQSQTMQNMNHAQVNGATISTSASGVQKVGIVGSTGTALDSTAGVLDANLKNVGGNAVVTGGANGSQSIGGTVATNVAPTQNPVIIGGISQATGSNPSAGTSTRTQQIATDVTGNVFVINGGPNLWSCTVSAVAASLTQCEAAPAAGMRAYITTVIAQTTTSTAGTTTIKYGTGTNCASGTTTLWGAYNTPISTTTPLTENFTTPLVPVAANAICVLGVATNTQTVTLMGYIAP